MEVSNTEAPEVVISEEEQIHNDAIEAHANKDTDGFVPSEEAEAEQKHDMFAGMTDEWKEANLKDGKLFGKFDDLDAMAKSYKKLNDERAENGTNAKVEAENATKEEIKATTSNTELGKIAENGFNISEENFKAFEEAGISRVEAENMSFKMEKAANKAYSMVGGKEQYQELMTWAGENLDATQIQAFSNETVGDNFNIKPSGEFAIRGLQAMMREGSTKAPTSRIAGNTPSNVQTTGYTSKKEYNEHYSYLRANPSDRNSQRMYEEKMKMTNMNNLR